MTQANFLSFHDPDDFRRLHDVFQAAGYTGKGVLEKLGVRDFPSIRGSDVSILLKRTDRGEPLDTLIRLFLMEVPCGIEAVQRAFHPVRPETLAEAGIINMDETQASAAVKILPYDGLLIAFDQTRMLQTQLRQNYVMGIGSSTMTLANLTIRRPSRLTLDLGAGCGIHAFLAARHSDRVMAADINPRAVRFAGFNARLNGLSNVACLEGDLFEPLKGLKFDLVVTNPPFVISPENRYIYRDGGMEADQICRKIAREAPQHLNEGGYCQILCNWIEPHGQEWYERMGEWFEGTGCDVRIMRSETRDAAAYASTWIRHTEKDDDAGQFAGRFEKWTAYYEQHGIKSIGAGLITIRRSDAHVNWLRADDAPEKMLGPCGEYIMRGFELRDFLETARNDSILLDTCFQVSPDARLERQCVPDADGWKDEALRLHLVRGFAYSGNMDPFMANVIAGCNGQRSLGNLLNEMACSLGTHAANIAPDFCNIIRSLIERGFLGPV